MKRLTDELLAYVAGCIDSRGHIEINSRHDRPQPRIRITTRRVELIEHLSKLTGTTVSIDERGYQRRPCSAHCSQQHQHVARQSSYWTVDSSRATIVLYNVQPWIFVQKADVAKALRVGLEAFPPARGDTHKQMAKLGWVIPEAT